LSGVGQKKITKYAIFDYPISVQDSPWMGKIGGYGDLMARGGCHWNFFKHQNHQPDY
jgi:hypothetical protein